MPFFSIVLPTYNRAHMLPKAIESVLSQTFNDWELIIVDDGSTDDTKKIVEGYTDQRIKYIYQDNQERSAARNNGIEHATGEYICFLDSDDYFLPEKLDSVNRFIATQTETEIIFYDGITYKVGEKINKIELPIRKENESVFEFLLMNPLGSMQICANSSILKKYKFNTKLRIGEDVELWIRIAEKYKFVPIINSYHTILVEHDERSVNLKNANSAIEQLKMLNYLFSKDDSGSKFRRKIKKRALSNSFFNIGKYFMYSNQRMKALFWILRSLNKDFSHLQQRHRMYCAVQILKGKIPEEYSI